MDNTQDNLDVKQGSKTILATSRLMEIWANYGRKDLSLAIKQNLLWFASSDPASYYKAVQNTVDQCRPGIVRKTGCVIEEAQVVALGLARVRVWNQDFRPHKYNFLFHEEPIGSRRSLVTRKIDVTSLPEMQSVAMQKAQNTRYMINPQIRDWYDSMGEERRAELGITEWQCTAANWLGDREYMLVRHRDDNTRQYADVHCSPNGDATSKNLVDYAEERAIDDEGLQLWSALLNKEWGVNLDNCVDIWNDRDELVNNGMHERAIGNALRLMDARDSHVTHAIARVDRYCALAQDQGMLVRDRKTLTNTNVLFSGSIIDPWMLVTEVMLRKVDWIQEFLPEKYRRSLSKKPGTPSGYRCGLSSATKAVVDDGDDPRDNKAIKAAVTEDLLSGAKPWVRSLLLDHLNREGEVVNNRNVWKACQEIASAVRTGMKKHLPASALCGKLMEDAVTKLGTETSWVTPTGYTRHYNPWIYADELDEDTQKPATVPFETEIWHPRHDETQAVHCRLVPLMERDLKQVLWGLPCACFTIERAAEDWKQYNAPFTIGDNHDESQCSPADLSELPQWNRRGLIFAHYSGPSPLEQVCAAAGVTMKYLGTPISKEEISDCFAG